MYSQQFALHVAKLCAQFIRLCQGAQKVVSFPRVASCKLRAASRACDKLLTMRMQKGRLLREGEKMENSPTSCKFAAVLTYDIQAECHRNLRLRIHLALVDAAVTWLRIFHMQRPILGVGGAYDLQAKCKDKS